MPIVRVVVMVVMLIVPPAMPMMVVVVPAVMVVAVGVDEIDLGNADRRRRFHNWPFDLATGGYENRAQCNGPCK
jgi:hypothetical protein